MVSERKVLLTFVPTYNVERMSSKQYFASKLIVWTDFDRNTFYVPKVSGRIELSASLYKAYWLLRSLIGLKIIPLSIGSDSAYRFTWTEWLATELLLSYIILSGKEQLIFMIDVITNKIVFPEKRTFLVITMSNKRHHQA